MRSPARLPRGRQPAFCPLPSWQWAAAASFRLTVFSAIPRPLRSFQGGGRRPTETKFCKRHHDGERFLFLIPCFLSGNLSVRPLLTCNI